MSYQQRGARREDLVAGLAYSHRLQLPQPPGARAQDRRLHLLPGRHRLQRRRGRRLQPDPGQGDHRAAAQRRHGRPRHGPAGARAHAAHGRAPRASAAGTSSRSTTRCKDFVCKHCSNECDVRQFTIEGEKTYWGDKCSDRYRKRPRSTRSRSSPTSSPSASSAAGALRGGAAARGRGARRTVGIAAHHVHLRPAAVLGHVLRAPGLAPRAVARERQAPSARPAWTHRGRAVLPHPRRPRPRAVAVAATAPTSSSCPTSSTKRPSSEEYNSHACPWGQTLPFVVRTAPGLESLPRHASSRRACASATAARAWCATCADMGRQLGACSGAAAPRPGRRHDRAAGASATRCWPPGREALADARGLGRAGHRAHRPALQHVRQGRQHGHPPQAAQVLRGQPHPPGLPAHQGHRHRRRGAQHVLELRAQDPAGGALRAATTSACTSST